MQIAEIMWQYKDHYLNTHAAFTTCGKLYN